ncbi:MAG: GTP-binding protein [Candidatus Hodarchaeota archaeon]
MECYDYTFKIMLIGDISPGKTAFTKRYISGFFHEDYGLTIGVDFWSTTTSFKDQKVKLQMWDFRAEERFKFLLSQYCKGANAAILMYDITNKVSLDHLTDWTKIIRENTGDIPIMLVGSKLYSGESRVVSRQEGISVAEKNNLSAFGEICSETGQNTDRVFEVLGELLFERYGLPLKIPSEFKINEYLELRLENIETNIYVGGRLFNQCKYLLLDIPIADKKNYEKIESIDEAAEKLDHSMERGSYKYYLSPDIEFWGHCSNLQAWYENNYNTRILHRNLAFPLLKALVLAGDPLAKRVFKEEIAIRLESGYPSVVLHLINQGYLKYLKKEELDIILEKPKFIKNLPKWFLKKDIPKWLTKRIEVKLKDLKCPYCDSKISNTSIQRFLNGKSVRCELCYSKITKD